MKNYSLGLDIGTNSIGWAVVDENNDVVKKNGKRLWGVRMFEEASSASERRTYRTSRRRLRRRRQRIEWLQEEFYDEIVKEDKTFFQRLNDSFYKIEDKTENNYYTYFNDLFTDKDFFAKYPTIYHLRKDLIEKDEKFDIRMIYLSIHHMVKYRGHFLNEGESFEASDYHVIAETFESINEKLLDFRNLYEDSEEYFESISISRDSFYDELKEIMLQRSSKKEKERLLQDLFGVNKKTFVNEFLIALLVKGKVDASSLSFVKDYKYDKKIIELSKETLLQDIEEAKQEVKELSNLIEYAEGIKTIVDFYYLLNLLGDHKYLSDSMVALYDSHHEDLVLLKTLIKTYLPEQYNDCFKVVKDKYNNYPRYVGMNSSNKQMKRFNHCSYDDFKAYIKSLLQKIKDEEATDLIAKITTKLDENEFLKRQNSGQNTTIPMQLNLLELKKILENQSKYYPFLMMQVDGLTRKERIEAIFKFHIPYYVGPLSNASENFAWLKRTNEAIRPWNFEKVVDIDATATNFIQRMQNKCTYLKGADDYCLPKKSLLFSEFVCLQYINKLKINGALIPIELKNEIFENVFLKYEKPTKKHIKEYIRCRCKSEIEDIPDVNCDMSSYIKFRSIFGQDFQKNKDMIESIIKDIVLFEDKSILERRLKELYKLDDEKVKKIKGLNYKGYGSLCKKLLAYNFNINEETGEVKDSIIEIMRNTNLNLQEILYSVDYNYIKAVDAYNEKLNNTTVSYREYIDEYLYVSPIMKRSLIQSYRLIDEIERILGQKIDSYYVECSRTNQAKKEPKNSRFENLKNLYNECKKMAKEFNEFNIDINKLNQELLNNKNNLRSDQLYLYFTQLGKCMYSLKNINFSSLASGDTYDIDHIYPQSLIKDDSISNRVLVDKFINQSKKGNLFLHQVPGLINEKNKRFYDLLLKNSLITKEKYRRLTQKSISPTELEGFINRQIVATNQSVVGLIQLLKLYKKVPDQKIIYSKAENISEFRNNYDILKSRTANNFHHAHDAYLNVVVGRAIHTYYETQRIIGSRDVMRVQNNKETLNPERILRGRVVTLQGKKVWDAEKTIAQIQTYINKRHDIFETIRTKTSNKLFSQVTIVQAKESDSIVPIKTSTLRCDVNKYGGIMSNSYCGFSLVKRITKKNVDEYILEAIPVSKKNCIHNYIASTIDSSKYPDFEIIKEMIPANVVIIDGKKKICITGKSGEKYLIKNLKDRIFSKQAIKTIRAIDKYLENKKLEYNMKSDENCIIVSPCKKLKNGRFTKEIKLTKEECNALFEEILQIFNKPIYDFTAVRGVLARLDKNKYYTLASLDNRCIFLNQFLSILKTNANSSADLSLVGLSSRSCEMRISKKLSPGVKIIAESITGYYQETIFEVPDVV